MVHRERKLTDEIVIELRALVKSGDKTLYRVWANKFGVNKTQIARAISGKYFKYLNEVESPARREYPFKGYKEQVESLYRDKVTKREIARTLGLSISTVNTLCKDLEVESKIEFEAKVARVRALYLTGEYSDLTISSMENVHRQAVRRWCEDLKNKRVKKFGLQRKRIIGAPMAKEPYLNYSMYHSVVNGAKRVRLINRSTNDVISLSLTRYLASVKYNRRLIRSDVVVVKEGGDKHNVDDLILMDKEDYREHLGIPSKLVCLSCSEEFKPRNRTHVYCSIACHPRTGGGGKQKYTHTCDVCEEEFTNTKEEGDFCGSKECRAIVRKFKYT